MADVPLRCIPEIMTVGTLFIIIRAEIPKGDLENASEQQKSTRSEVPRHPPEKLCVYACSHHSPDNYTLGRDANSFDYNH